MTDPPAKLRQTYSFGEFSLDLERCCLRRGPDEVKLRPKVFEALKYLVTNDNRLVTKDELMRALWPDAFVTDDSLVQCVVELRRALGDEAQAFVKTVPRRGYVFTAHVTAGDATGTAPAAIPRPAARSVRRRIAVASVLLGFAAIAAAAYFVAGRRPRPVLTDQDSILIADFANTTGDDVFDGPLRQAMAVQLGQSPFVNVFPDERVRETLRYMGRSPDERVTRDLAREIAQRQGLKALLAGSIASLGHHYVVSVEVVNAATGEALLREQVEAEGRERVLGRLGEAAARLRERLGESVSSIERFAAPLEQATTPSLEAFKAYDRGRQMHFRGEYFEAIPLYRRAVELDPNFAIAYAALGITYATAREYELAAQSSERAFALRERATERERFYISARYYVDVLGDGDRAIEVLELWRQTYPRDFVPRTNLSARYSAIGSYERAVEEAREGLRLNPDAGVAYAAVAHSSICAGRYVEARAAIEQARARKLEPPYARYMLFGLSFVEGDTGAMQQQVDAVVGTASEPGMLVMQSVTAASRGQVRRARELTERAVDLAMGRGLKEVAGLYSAGDALWEAAYGNCREAKRAADRTLVLSHGRPPLSWSALALAMCGDDSAAHRLAGEISRRFPRDSFVRSSWLPMTHAAIEMHRGHPARAVKLLQGTAPTEAGTDATLWPAYLRGLAHLANDAGDDARTQFQKVLDRQGVLAPKDFNPAGMTLYPLAYIGRVRAGARRGDAADSRQACEALLAHWKDADEGVAIVRSARRECGRLGVGPTVASSDR